MTGAVGIATRPSRTRGARTAESPHAVRRPSASQLAQNAAGIEAFRKHNDSMFNGLDKVEWTKLRQFAIGQIVINDRIDEFYPYPGSKTPRMRFRVAGYFLIVDNKIKVWRDFPYPGSKQLIEPAPKAS